MISRLMRKSEIRASLRGVFKKPEGSTFDKKLWFANRIAGLIWLGLLNIVGFLNAPGVLVTLYILGLIAFWYVYHIANGR